VIGEAVAQRHAAVARFTLGAPPGQVDEPIDPVTRQVDADRPAAQVVVLDQGPLRAHGDEDGHREVRGRRGHRVASEHVVPALPLDVVGELQELGPGCSAIDDDIDHREGLIVGVDRRDPAGRAAELAVDAGNAPVVPPEGRFEAHHGVVRGPALAGASPRPAMTTPKSNRLLAAPMVQFWMTTPSVFSRRIATSGCEGLDSARLPSTPGTEGRML
jgi:hypothetical protein